MGNPAYTSACTFTPEATGNLSLLVDFDGITQVGNDWSTTGNYCLAYPFILQNSTYSLGSQQRIGTAYHKFTLQHTTLVNSGALVTCGLKLEAFGLSTISAENINVRAELLKET